MEHISLTGWGCLWIRQTPTEYSLAEGIGQPYSHEILDGGVIGLGEQLSNIHLPKVLVSLKLHPIWGEE